MLKGALTCALVIVGVVVLCIMSRTVARDSKLGSYSSDAIRRTCLKLLRECAEARAASLQDELPSMALTHNSEALAKVRCAMALATEYALSPPLRGAQEMEADLREEREASLHSFALEIDSDSQ